MNINLTINLPDAHALAKLGHRQARAVLHDVLGAVITPLGEQERGASRVLIAIVADEAKKDYGDAVVAAQKDPLKDAREKLSVKAGALAVKMAKMAQAAGAYDAQDRRVYAVVEIDYEDEEHDGPGAKS